MHPHAKFRHCGLKKCGSTAPKIGKIGIFCYKFAQKGYIPLSDFYYILSWEKAPGPHPYAKFHRHSFKMWPYGPKKSPKMVIFGKKFAPLEKFWGSIGELEHRCTTTNLPLCNDTIIVLKIILLQSVSVITNFLIPKRDKKNRQTKNITLFCLQPARDPGSPPYLAR